MFVHCNKNLHIQEGSEELNLQRGFVGQIDDRWANHWFVRAALSDGTIESPDTGKRVAKDTGKKATKDTTKETSPEPSAEDDSKDTKTE